MSVSLFMNRSRLTSHPIYALCSRLRPVQRLTHVRVFGGILKVVRSQRSDRTTLFPKSPLAACSLREDDQTWENGMVGTRPSMRLSPCIAAKGCMYITFFHLTNRGGFYSESWGTLPGATASLPITVSCRAKPIPRAEERIFPLMILF